MKKVIHIDCDAFYAAVEMRDNPELKNVPIAIGGGSNGRGVLCTSNYLARKFGVRSAMPTFLALKKCPHLQLIRPNFQKYKKVSQEIHEIFNDYTDLIEPLSLDEAYLDVTDSSNCHNSATLMAKEIRERVEREIGITVSAGIAQNKFLAKVASDWNKPNGLFLIDPKHQENFLINLELRKINGIGKKTAEKLFALGLKTCGDARNKSLSYLNLHFGSLGEMIYRRAHGIDNREVAPYSVPKSISLENTLSNNIKDISDINDLINPMLSDLIMRIQNKKSKYGVDLPFPKKAFVKLKTSTFRSHTMECILPNELRNYELTPTSFSQFEKIYRNLFTELFCNLSTDVRLLGMGVRLNSDDKAQEQLSLFDDLVIQDQVA